MDSQAALLLRRKGNSVRAVRPGPPRHPPAGASKLSPAAAREVRIGHRYALWNDPARNPHPVSLARRRRYPTRLTPGAPRPWKDDGRRSQSRSGMGRSVGRLLSPRILTAPLTHPVNARPHSDVKPANALSLSVGA